MHERWIRFSVFFIGACGLGTLFFWIFFKSEFYLEQIPPSELKAFQSSFEIAFAQRDIIALEEAFSLPGLFAYASDHLGRFTKRYISRYLYNENPALGIGEELLRLQTQLQSSHFLGTAISTTADGVFMVFRSYDGGRIDYLVLRIGYFQGLVKAYDYLRLSEGEWRSTRLSRKLQMDLLQSEQTALSVKLRFTDAQLQLLENLDNLILRREWNQAFRMLEKWSPSGEEAILGLGVQALRIGFYTQNEELFQSAVQFMFDQDDPWLAVYAQYFQLRANYDNQNIEHKLLDEFKKWVGDDDPILALHDAKLAKQQKLYPEAERFYLQVIAAYPFLLEPYFYLLDCMVEQEDHQRSFDLLLSIKEKFNINDYQLESLLQEYPTLLESLAYRRFRGVKEI